MKPARTIAFALALLAGALTAHAQPNSVPGPGDYARFSSFIADRNIFNPARYARDFGSRPSFTPTRPRFAPTFSLVGIMSYEKGVFAFFDGNQSDLRKVLYPSASNSIAGFSVAQISPNSVTLQSADKSQTVLLKIGDRMLKADNAWQKAGPGASLAESTGSESAAPAEASDDTAPPSSGESNDILKRLMQQRQQEEK